MATQKRFIAKNGLDNNAQTITNVATPVNTTDAVTKAYADLKPDLSSTTPAALGTATVGTGTTAARADHVHQSPTTISGNAGTATSIAGQTTNGVLYQSGSGVTTSTAESTAAGQVLTTTTLGGAPTWVTPTGGTGTVTGVTGTAPIVSSGGTAPVISMAAATTSVPGYLTAADWTTFNGKYSTGGALGTPSSGTLTNCTFPTLNQNTTGSSGSCTGNAASATQLSATQQTSPITGSLSSMTMTADSVARGSFCCRATGTSDANLAGMTFWNDAYALKLGIRADGFFGLGGWSRGAWSWYSDTLGNMVAAGNVTAYSDPRLKDDIKLIKSPLDIINSLDGVTFTWNDRSKLIEAKWGKRDYGVLADQVKAVMPEIVTASIDDEDGVKYDTVDYSKIVPVLIEAIKELSAEVKLLKEAK